MSDQVPEENVSTSPAQVPAPQPTNLPPVNPQPENSPANKSSSIIIWIIIIIIIIGGAYAAFIYLQKNINSADERITPPTEIINNSENSQKTSENTETDNVVQNLQTINADDSLNTINQDLSTTDKDINSLDEGVNDLDNGL